jgi:tetratricopeptide (TPR) repeat protein
LAKRDVEAREFLATDAGLNGFTNDGELRSALEFVLSQAPHDPGALFEMGRLFRRLGDNGRARELFDAVLEVRPADPIVSIQKSAALRAEGRLDEARGILDSVLQRTVLTAEHGSRIRRVIAERDRIFSDTNRQLKLKLKGLEQVQADNDKLRGELERVRLNLDAVRQDLLETVRSANELEKRLRNDLSKSRLEAMQRESSLKKQLTNAQREISAIRESTSWRVTAPLRALVSLWRR